MIQWLQSQASVISFHAGPDDHQKLLKLGFSGKSAMAMYWVYVLRCANEHYYTGYTVDLLRRYREHCQGSLKCKYTRSFKPIEMVQCWPVANKSMALRLEYAIKQLSRPAKQQLLSQPERISHLLEPLLSS